MLPASRTHSSTLSLLRGVPRSLRRDVIFTQLTSSTAIRNNTTYSRIHNQRTSRFKWTRRLFWGLLFGTLGYYSGKSATNAFFHPAKPGSKEDAQQLKRVRKLADRHPFVKELRLDPKFDEWDAYEDIADADKEQRLTCGPLTGSRGLALQKIFWNEAEKKCVNIVRFGPSTEGWPSIVHGGLLATVLDETLGRVAIRSVPAHTGVTAHLDVQYQYLMLTERFYKIIATLDRERSTDRKSYVTAYIYDREGKLYCKGEALFVVPKNISLRPLERF